MPNMIYMLFLNKLEKMIKSASIQKRVYRALEVNFKGN